MKTNHWLALTALLALGIMRPGAQAQDAAVVQQERVNVRGQPSLGGEVITQLRKGEPVTVLEEIPVKSPKPGEPEKWLRIAMPPNTPVWVHAPLIDPTNKTVTIKKINVRAGPGENFSVVGRLEKGDVVKEIRIVNDWMEIETPTGAYAFVAADLLKREKTAEETQIAAAPPPAPAPAPAPPAPPPVAAAPAQPAPAVPAPVVPPTVTPEAATPAPELPAISPIPPRRVVTRQGIVRTAFSLRAPGDYLLESVESGRKINFLYTTTTNISLKTFRNKVVVVSGEEALDDRWPNTPVLTIETIEPAR
jgi:uncharacterized protein YgiM (DUF1202 family)